MDTHSAGRRRREGYNSIPSEAEGGSLQCLTSTRGPALEMLSSSVLTNIAFFKQTSHRRTEKAGC